MSILNSKDKWMSKTKYRSELPIRPWCQNSITRIALIHKTDVAIEKESSSNTQIPIKSLGKASGQSCPCGSL